MTVPWGVLIRKKQLYFTKVFSCITSRWCGKHMVNTTWHTNSYGAQTHAPAFIIGAGCSQCQSLRRLSDFFVPLRGTSCRLNEGEAPITERYTSRAPLSNDPLIRASKSFIFQRNTARWQREGKKEEEEEECVSPYVCVFGVNSWLTSHFKWPCGAQSVNKQSPTKPLCSFFLSLSFSFHLFPPLTHYTSSLLLLLSAALPLLVPAQAQKLSTANTKLKWVYNNRFSCCHRSLDPSLFNHLKPPLGFIPYEKEALGIT